MIFIFGISRGKREAMDLWFRFKKYILINYVNFMTRYCKPVLKKRGILHFLPEVFLGLKIEPDIVYYRERKSFDRKSKVLVFF